MRFIRTESRIIGAVSIQIGPECQLRYGKRIVLYLYGSNLIGNFIICTVICGYLQGSLPVRHLRRIKRTFEAYQIAKQCRNRMNRVNGFQFDRTCRSIHGERYYDLFDTGTQIFSDSFYLTACPL